MFQALGILSGQNQYRVCPVGRSTRRGKSIGKDRPVNKKMFVVRVLWKVKLGNLLKTGSEAPLSGRLEKAALTGEICNEICISRETNHAEIGGKSILGRGSSMYGSPEASLSLLFPRKSSGIGTASDKRERSSMSSEGSRGQTKRDLGSQGTGLGFYFIR